MPEAKAGFLSQVGALYREHPAAAWTTTAVVLGTITYLALQLIAAAGSGDEPPIRVKGGSIHFEIVSTTGTGNTWVKQGSNWVVGPGKQNSEKLGLIVVAPTSNCPSMHHDKDEISIEYTDANGTASTLTLNAKNTKKKSVNPGTVKLDLDGTDNRKLRSSDEGGYISKVDFGDLSCKFTKDQLEELYVFEW